MKRGKQPILLNKVDLQNCISELESVNAFQSRSQLWTAVENSDFAKKCTPRPLTAQVAMLKAEALEIVIKTPKGRRGNPGGLKNVVRTGRRIRLPMAELTKAKLLKNFPVAQHPIIERAAKGSLKAIIKAKCLDCSCYVPSEVKNCTVMDCPLWSVRPYKTANAV